MINEGLSMNNGGLSMIMEGLSIYNVSLRYIWMNKKGINGIHGMKGLRSLIQKRNNNNFLFQKCLVYLPFP